jgi:hypothetical protein
MMLSEACILPLPPLGLVYLQLSLSFGVRDSRIASALSS